ncbi:MAG: PhoH family protein [Armatimonadetes bacterium]|nr:PhoH family protein [Armatimonadota bacterium]
MVREIEARIGLEGNLEAVSLLGQEDRNMKLFEKELAVSLNYRNGALSIAGEEGKVHRASRFLKELLAAFRGGHELTAGEVKLALQLVQNNQTDHIAALFTDSVYVTYRGKQIKARTVGQKRYVEAIKRNDMVFGIGPAGTGKTYLAVATALLALRNREVVRIVITRPAVEAGERLGFLPGDLQEKVNPYLRPIYDALYEMMEFEKVQKHMERGVIEVAPLAYMRGRSLNDSFIILDEAQNTTYEQMKMFLTRLGFGSKAVITGDITQIDLPSGKFSGLLEARKVLKGVRGVEFVTFSERDVVRHELVKKIIRAFERYEDKDGNSARFGAGESD